MQRKRHINFKDFLIRFSGSRKSKLHSIPTLSFSNTIANDNGMKNDIKSNVLYSIPCIKSYAHFCRVRTSIFLLLALIEAFCVSSFCANSTYAAEGGCNPCDTYSVVEDSGTISPVSGGTSTPATASLSLSKTSLISNTVTPGNIATADTNVTVNVSNANSYSLTIKVDSTNITANGTTLTAGNVSTDNTWGYKWDGATSYTAPSTTAQTLVVPALSNGATSFTKNLTFGAKFSSNANAGHYRGSGTLSLVATPKATTYTLADLTQMQQLAPDYAPDACANTVIPTGQDYAGPYTLTDVRDNNTYTVYKFKDGKCWMTENLRLKADSCSRCEKERKLIPATSDIAAEWSLPASDDSGFTGDNTAVDAYYDENKNIGYYSWCAATAGTCGAAALNMTNAPSSICPKGWKLPTGYQQPKTDNDFWLLFRNMGLTISNDSLASTTGGSAFTSWGSGDRDIVLNAPYSFAYNEQIDNASEDIGIAGGSAGVWWSRTAASTGAAYRLIINTRCVYPGNSSLSRYLGLAMRCVVE